ncbi:MATE family efflux transporter [Fusobacterium sp. 1001295B_180824_G3]|uniref:MATE family efflux transporter n=1 Tax=Fusobacterium sp. 1001295B_180824_G3 TaxID=2787123 RepID=UPI001E3C215C|nr:MATE family efflux transporter [Fusobacterium sp. 1001295B_180824_G3]
MKDLTQGDELKTIIYFSLPILMGNIFQQIYNISDAIIIGNFLGKESLAAVGSSYQINVLIIAISIGISLGTSILISQCFGAKNIEKLKNAVNTGFIFSIILSFIITIFGFILSNRILILINVPENLLLNSNIYLKIIFIGVIPTFAYNSLTNILKGIGDSKTPTYILIVTVILNIILDIFFIAIMNYGISGAAIATVISQFISFILCFFLCKIKIF